ncbi:ABC transporter ATP-binding protein [Promicromonospora sp. NPDC023805]|uniref:ABC transporter ATP-binding protein n=1 Tax=Promicromonospora sp. NPDC023805 TaxID=3154696 RepID=UPI0033EDC203
MISLTRVSVEYGDKVKPLDDVSHTFLAGTTAVTGPSGSGKSTLLRLIAGVQSPKAGTVAIDGEPVGRASWFSAGDPRVSVIYQDHRLVPFLTVAQNLSLAVESRGAKSSADQAEAALARVGLPSSTSHRFPGSMSSGEQQRVAVARALAVGSPVLVADEPTGALDAENTARITDVLLELGQSGDLTVIVATHDMSVAERMDQRIGLGAGRLLVAA